MSAYERIVDLLLELHDRLAMAGLSAGYSFALPLTQEVIADALGINSVHVNRTLQAMRRDGLVDIRSGSATLRNLETLRDRAEYHPISEGA